MSIFGIELGAFLFRFMQDVRKWLKNILKSKKQIMKTQSWQKQNFDKNTLITYGNVLGKNKST